MMTDARVAAALPWAVMALWLTIAAWAAFAYRRTRHTTLAAPAAWCVASALTMVAAEFYLEWADVPNGSSSASIWRYAAAVSSCCPLMAVLGAKRPQDRGWQWIVVSLWVTLLVPAGQAIAASSAGELELFVVWRLLLGGLIAMALLNYLPTRYALPALFSAAAQMLLLYDYLFDQADEPSTRFLVLVGPPVLLLIACAVAEYVRYRAARQLADRRTARWLEFRNGWGAFWALRVMQRVNQTAEGGGWPVRLEWGGFALVEAKDNIEPVDANAGAQIDQALDSLLWRFERKSGLVHPSGL